MEQSPATNATFLQVRQSDASGNSSFLPGLEEALLTRSLSFSSLCISDCSHPEPCKAQELKKKRHFSLPPLLLAPFPEAKQQRGAVCCFFWLFFFFLLLEAGVETYAEQHQI